MSKEILLLTPFFKPNIGGAETFVDGLCEEAKRWFNVTVLTFQPFQKRAEASEEYYYPKGSLRIRRLKWSFSHHRAWQGLSARNFITVVPKMLFSAFVMCLKKKYDIVHAQGLLSGLVGAILKRLFGFKLYITLLALYNFKNWEGIKRKGLEYILSQCDLIFVEGWNGQKDIDGFITAEKIRIFNHWCDQEIFKPEVSNRNAKPRAKTKILFIGRPLPQKGRHIIEGAERILNKNPGGVWIEEKSHYEFIYLENIPYKDLPKYYQMADVVCVPSLYDEGYSRVVIEAASCGCLVIASNRGSLPEMVSPFGKVIEPTAENFANEIRGKWSGSEHNGYVYAKEHFSSKNADIFLNEYTNS